MKKTSNTHKTSGRIFANLGRTLVNAIAILVLTLAGQTVGHAEIIADVANYFRPVSGALIAIHGDDYLVDLDAASGVMVGDLLSIVIPGEKLVDPETGTVLGRMDTFKGVLKVTRVRSGFSQAKPLGAISSGQKGDSVRRYQNLTAIFTVQNESDLSLYERLTHALPSLEWQGAYPVAKNGSLPIDPSNLRVQLTFNLSASALDVFDGSGQVIRSFSVPGQVPSAQRAESSKTSGRGGASPLAMAPNTTAVIARDKSNSKNHSQTTYSADYPGFQTLGEFSAMVVAADITSKADEILLAESNGADIRVFAVSDQMRLLYSSKKLQQGNIHALAWWQPEKNGPLYLAVTSSAAGTFSYSASVETVFVSSIYRFTDNQLVMVAQRIPYLLGAFDQNGDGNKETLLGQKFDLDTVFGTIQELTLSDSGYTERALELKLPLGFPVRGSIFADLTGDGHAEAIYTRRGILYILSEGKLLYESAKQMGGSLSRLTYDINPGQADALFTTVAFEVPQVAADIDGDGKLELIAVSASKSAFSATGLNDRGSEGWLSVIKYQNGRFVKGTLGERLEQPIQGLAVKRGQALIVLSRKGSILDGQGKSHLLALPLAP